MRRSIPIHDETAPVTCTLSEAEIPERIALLERLRSAMVRLEPAPHGLLLHFPADPAIEADVRSFAIDEKRCCQFWGFAVDTSNAGITLRWDAPKSARDLLGQLEQWLRSEAPAKELRGLL